MITISHKSKLLSLVTVTVILTNCSFATPFYRAPVPGQNEVIVNFGTGPEKSLPKQMGILVWNLHKGEDNTFPKDFNELAYKKDILVTQEMQLDTRMNSVFAGLPLNYYSTATSFFIGKEHFRTGVATGSEVKPNMVNFVRTQTLEPIAKTPKVTLITHYPISNSTKQLTVVNIHGINFVDAASYRKEMVRIYEEIKEIPSPLIFAGDFNSWNEERLSILKEMANKLKLKEASFSPDNRLRFNKHPLDHFYYTDDINILEAKVEGFYQGSDHKPLELVIEYSPLSKITKAL